MTYPLTTSMLAVPNTKVVRGYSFFGLSFVYIIFEDNTDMVASQPGQGSTFTVKLPATGTQSRPTEEALT